MSFLFQMQYRFVTRLEIACARSKLLFLVKFAYLIILVLLFFFFYNQYYFVESEIYIAFQHTLPATNFLRKVWQIKIIKNACASSLFYDRDLCG
jgi:hypothetical protein